MWRPMALLRSLNPFAIVEFLVDSVIRLLGPLLIVFALSLIGGVIHVYFSILLPNAVQTPVWRAIHMTIAFFLIFVILFNFTMAIAVQPGSPVAETGSETSEAARLLASEPVPERGTGFTRWCKICKVAKPPRTHHCHICKKCVFKMDHHCPWIAGCVGFWNYRYFYLFMLFTWVGALYSGAMSLPPFLGAMSKGPQDFRERSGVVYVFAVTLAITLALGGLVSWHTYLTLTGQTTIEFYHNRFRKAHARTRGEVFVSEFDLGYRENLHQVFGCKRLWAILLPSTRRLPGDGTAFPTRDSVCRSQAFDDYAKDCIV